MYAEAVSQHGLIGTRAPAADLTRQGSPLEVTIVCSSPIIARGLQLLLARQGEAGKSQLPGLFHSFHCPWLLLAEARLAGVFFSRLEMRSSMFLSPDVDVSILWHTIGALGSGQRPSLRHELMARFAQGTNPRLTGWSRRLPTAAELQCGCAVSLGLSNREIAEALSLTEATVKSHVHRLLEKFKLSRREDLGSLFGRALAPLPSDVRSVSFPLQGCEPLLDSKATHLKRESQVMVVPQEDALFTRHEQRELETQERLIEQGIRTFWRVGQALKTVRDKRLYRERYPTFDQYCQKRWGLGRQYAYRMIDGAAVIEDLSPIGDSMLPANEAQVRPLTRLKDPEERRTVWREVLAAAPETPVTAALVRRVVQLRLPQPPPHPVSPTVEPMSVAEAEQYILALARQYAKAPLEEKRTLSQRLLTATRYLAPLDEVNPKGWLFRAFGDSRHQPPGPAGTDSPNRRESRKAGFTPLGNRRLGTMDPCPLSLGVAS
jgi:DNA-binding NarL/FixJ family response regulator